MPRTKETAKAMKAAGAALKGAGKAKATAKTEIDRQKAAKKKQKALPLGLDAKKLAEYTKRMGAGGAVSEKEMKMLKRAAGKALGGSKKRPTKRPTSRSGSTTKKPRRGGY